MQRLKVSVVLVIFVHLQTLVLGDGFEAFVRNKVRDFPEWIKENHLDPSPPMSTDLNLQSSESFIKFDINISNLVLSGLDNPYEADLVLTNLLEGTFDATMFTHSPLVFSGSHKTNACILETPVNAEGYWNISVENYGISFGITFEILPFGYLNLTHVRYCFHLLPNAPPEMYFEGVTDHEAAQGYEHFLRGQLYMAFTWAIDLVEVEVDPTRASVIRYWETVLARTTLADLIEATNPPTTRDTTDVQDPWSTSTLIPCNMMQQTDKFIYTEKKILETWESVDTDGTPVTLTELVVVKKQRHKL